MTHLPLTQKKTNQLVNADKRDDLIECAATAIYYADHAYAGTRPLGWNKMTQLDRELYRQEATAALDAVSFWDLFGQSNPII